MKLVNIGSKIINVGATVLMPDSEMQVTEEVASLPAIKAFERMGLVKVKKDARAVAPAKESVHDEAPSDENAPEESVNDDEVAPSEEEVPAEKPKQAKKGTRTTSKK